MAKGPRSLGPVAEKSALTGRAVHQELAAVRTALKRGADANKSLMDSGETPLLYASRRGFTGAVSALFDAGVV